MIRAFAFVLLSVLLLFSSSASGESLWEWLEASEDHKVLFRLLSAANLQRFLNNFFTRFTVFAPTDDAFAKFATLITDTKLKNDEEIFLTVGPVIKKLIETDENINVVLYHSVPRGKTLLQLQDDSPLTTLSRAYTLSVNADDKTVQDNEPSRAVRITIPDIDLDNGFIHVIPEVLLPISKDKLSALIASLSLSSVPPQTITTDDAPGAATESPVAAGDLPMMSPMVSPMVSPMMSPMMSPMASPLASPLASPFGLVDSDSLPPAYPELSNISDYTPSLYELLDPTRPSVVEEECFPASALVTLASGETIAMKDLTAEHEIKHSSDGTSRVFLFTHRSPAVRSRMVRITTSCDHAVTLSPAHYLRTPFGLVAARHMRVNEDVLTVSGTCKVVNVERVAAVGLYAPHTIHGDIIVDGVVASSYVQSVHPRVAHALLLPVRFFVKRQSMFKEPLGSLLYDGASKWVHKLIPRGGDRVMEF